PGFPAFKTQRNEDLAERLAQSLGRDVYVLHYRGLGQNLRGPFSFEASAEQATACIQWLRTKYQSLSFVGHSWGGGLTVRNFDKLDAGSIVFLISPLVLLPPKPALERLVNYIYNDAPQLFPGVTVPELLADLARFATHFDSKAMVRKYEVPSKNLVYIQAKVDEETPVEYAREVVPCFKTKPLYIESEQDHSFTQDREAIYLLIEKAFKK
ncbi:alpha/beta hydrolase, partial [bacterium]|nr:alpha/beta hydrolase [bacterium]